MSFTTQGPSRTAAIFFGSIQQDPQDELEFCQILNSVTMEPLEQEGATE